MKIGGDKVNIIPFRGLVLVLLIFLATSFVLAAHVLTPAVTDFAGFSANETLANVYNISINNTNVGIDANITTVNFTLPPDFVFVDGSNWTDSDASPANFSNTTTVLTWVNYSSTTYLINGSVDGTGTTFSFSFNATVAIPGNYNITITTINGTDHAFKTVQNISVKINDTTSPHNVSFDGDATTPVNNSNLTSQDWIIVNVTVNDSEGSYAGAISNVSYSLFYSNGTLFNKTVETANSHPHINWTGLPDAIYHVNASANDTLGHDSTGGTGTRVITIDNTNPTASASCTGGTQLQEGAATTCSCSGTDATSGVKTSSASTTPDTSNTGTYSYTCSVTDWAGNSATNKYTYTIEGASSGGGSGGGGGGSSSGGTTGEDWDVTHTASAQQFDEGFTKVLGAKHRVSLVVEGENHHVGVKSLTDSSATIEVSSIPQEATLLVGDERKFDVTGNGFYDVLVKLGEISYGTASITMTSISEEVTTDTIEDEDEKESAADDVASDEEKEGGYMLWVIIAIALIVIAVYFGKKRNSSLPK